MSVQWTNQLEIIRGLQEAQGTIHVDIHNTVYTKGNPLNQSLIESNTMDAPHCCDDFEFKGGPDLKFIKKILDMVRHTNTSPDIVLVNGKSMLDVRKIDPLLKVDNQIIFDEVNAPKTRKQRNVALASILEAISTRNLMDCKPDGSASTASIYKTEPHMKLLKPEDFIIKDESDNSMEAVYSIVNISSPNVTNISFKNKRLLTSDSYKPSFMADLYYKNYLERNKLKRMHHNFMRGTEHHIKIVNLKEPKALCLPQHRHILDEECIVCKILCKTVNSSSVE